MKSNITLGYTESGSRGEATLGIEKQEASINIVLIYRVVVRTLGEGLTETLKREVLEETAINSGPLLKLRRCDVVQEEGQDFCL